MPQANKKKLLCHHINPADRPLTSKEFQSFSRRTEYKYPDKKK